MTIDLRSDTVTRPTEAMLRAMCKAPLGDDSYRDDHTVIELERYCASLFEKEEALFTSSGTMSNQLALRSLTRPGDEVILDAYHHINYYESAQAADLARVTLNVCETSVGVLTETDLNLALARKPRGPTYSRPVLVCIENSLCHSGGLIFPLEHLKRLSSLCMRNGISLYMDGARLLNACIAAKVSPAQYADPVSALSLCFAKGLGAPFGSVLVGDRETISRARMYRKWYGGALHQGGLLAAAALYSLQNNMQRLEEDHRAALDLASRLRRIPGRRIVPQLVETNIVLLDITELPITVEEFICKATARGVLLLPWGSNLLRAVTHLDVPEYQIEQAAHILEDLCNEISQGLSQDLEAARNSTICTFKRAKMA